MELENNIIPESVRGDFPPGVICVASGELARYPTFSHDMVNLLRPRRTAVAWNCGLNVAANFNNGIREMLANPDYQWAWIMGDDHGFDDTTLLRLLDRDLDIVVPLVVRRQAPFIPVLFREPYDDTPFGQFPPYHWHELPPHGLFEVFTAGSAGMLIKRRVFEAMEDPWFETGKMGREMTNEDTYFCLKAQKAGFKVFADCDVQMAHWTPFSLNPVRRADGRWTVGVDMGAGVKVVLPPQSLVNMVMNTKERTKENFVPSLKAVP